MSEGRPEYFLNFDAANELDELTRKARDFLEKHAAEFAADENSDLVETGHIRRAGELLFPEESVRPRSIYLSHYHEDRDFVDELLKKIKAAGLKCRTAKNIRPGANWPAANWKLIRGCHVFLCVVTHGYLKGSPWFFMELGAASAAMKNVVLALRHVTPGEIPSPFDHHQSVKVDNSKQVKALIGTLKRLCSD